MAMNPVDAADATPIAYAHGGDRCGMAIGPSDATAADNWLISDQITAGTGSEFKFWVLTVKDDWGLESYNVLVSTTNNSIGSFSAIASNETAPASWTQKTYDLSAYAGQDIYVAVQHTSADKFMFFIDDIEITTGITDVNNLNNKIVNVYPVPANNFINITNSVNSTINIIDINGQTIISEKSNSNIHTINISDLNQGTYFVKVVNENNVTVKKIIKK